MAGRAKGPVLVVDAVTSERMAGVRQHGTAAELKVRRVVSELGYHYRVRNRDLPGSPDLANRTRRWAVYVHGCFWHRHPGCRRTTTPKRNRDFWESKFKANVERDARVQSALRDRGFVVVVVWECEAERSPEVVRQRVAAALGPLYGSASC